MSELVRAAELKIEQAKADKLESEVNLYRDEPVVSRDQPWDPAREIEREKARRFGIVPAEPEDMPPEVKVTRLLDEMKAMKESYSNVIANLRNENAQLHAENLRLVKAAIEVAHGYAKKIADLSKAYANQFTATADAMSDIAQLKRTYKKKERTSV